MGGEWRERTLGELTENFDDIRVPVKEGDRRAGPYPYYGASGIVDYVDAFLFDGEYLLIAEDGENLRTRTTPVAFMARGKFWVNNHAHIVRGNGEADTRFLMYSLAATDFSGYLTGSTMPKLTQGNMNRIPLLTPPLPEQRAIAHILGTLDDKIEMNRRMNETLEGIARALFKSWFVDFDPVRRNMARKGRGQPSPGALRRPLPEGEGKKEHGRHPSPIGRGDGGEGVVESGAFDYLFPDTFVESELGEIPEGWGVASLREHFDADKGVSYKGGGLAGAGVPLHNLNSIYEGGGYKYEGIKYYTGEYASRHEVRPGDLIVANTEQGHDRLLIGFAAIVPWCFGAQGIASHHIYRLRPKCQSHLSTAYFCHLLNSAQMHDIVSGYANGTTVNMLPLSGVQQPLIVVPPSRLVAAFDALAVSVLDRHEETIAESRTLAALRDTLLPKLISGEVRVKAVNSSR